MDARGYFSVGVEGISKSFNLGNLMRTAHSFGASSFFTINDAVVMSDVRGTDTSDSTLHLPFYRYPTVADLVLPKDCVLVGVELLPDAVDLPSFRHPLRAAYVLGPEMGSLSPELIKRCAYTVKIPAKFCVNVGVAGAIVMYDRMVSLGRYAERPVSTSAHKR